MLQRVHEAADTLESVKDSVETHVAFVEIAVETGGGIEEVIQLKIPGLLGKVADEGILFSCEGFELLDEGVEPDREL